MLSREIYLVLTVVLVMLTACSIVTTQEDTELSGPMLTETAANQSAAGTAAATFNTREVVPTSTTVITAASSATEEPGAIDEATLLTITPPTKPEGAFLLETVNTTVPDDILEEVVFFPTGGGSPGCVWKTDGIKVSPETLSIELNDVFELSVCGWEGNESSIEVSYPDGQLRTVQGKIYNDSRDHSPYLDVNFFVGIDSPVGIYTFTFPYQGRIEQVLFRVIEPPAPRLYAYIDTDILRPTKLLLYNFLPYEEVRLFAYLERGPLVGWQSYYTDAHGNFEITRLPNEALRYVVVGEQSGVVPSYRVNGILSLTPIMTTEILRDSCVNDSKFIADLNIPDNTVIQAGQVFTKTWLLQNIGTCTWTTAYQYVHVDGFSLGAPPSLFIPTEVRPGEQLVLSIAFVAPEHAGYYVSEWKLQAPNGTPFGVQPYVLISVAE